MATKFNYFKAFEEMSEYSMNAALYLEEVVNNFDASKINIYISTMHEFEHREDEKKHEIMSHLLKEFLPPIEREDIIELAAKLDDVTDTIDELIHQFYIFNIQKLLPEFPTFVNVIKECCTELDLSIKELKNFKKSSTIHQNIIHVNNAESKGDSVYTDIMHRLFTTDGITPLDAVRWSDILNTAEDCCDACEEASETIENIIMKNI